VSVPLESRSRPNEIPSRNPDIPWIEIVRSATLGFAAASILDGNRWPSGLDRVVESSAVVGLAWGLVDAVRYADDPFKRGWDGMMTGVAAPGMLIGGLVGGGIGWGANTVMGKPMDERAWVGWSGGGALIGGATTVFIGAQGVGRSVNRMFGLDENSYKGYIVTAAGIGTYQLSAVLDGIDLAAKAQKQYSSDEKCHQAVTRQIRRRYDPGTALMLGCAKELRDFALGTGTPEWRDLENDWRGAFELN
ncbi:hypothetical protein EBR96_09580, partial [bacterium]|nr:hypothetical protein [bacterium]